MDNRELCDPYDTAENSPDGDGRTDRTYGWSVYQDGAHSGLWYAVFRKDTGSGSGFAKGTQPLCVRAASDLPAAGSSTRERTDRNRYRPCWPRPSKN